MKKRAKQKTNWYDIVISVLIASGGILTLAIMKMKNLI